MNRSPIRPIAQRITTLVATLVATLVVTLSSACTEERSIDGSDASPPAIRPPVTDVAPWPDATVDWPDVPLLPDGGTAPDASRDAGVEPPPRDTGEPQSDPWPATYGHVAPAAGSAPEALTADTWLTHLRDDLLPYWTMAAALGDPVGNFPTYRGMDGAVRPPAERRPRMISRQTYAYAMAFLMTGDAALLGYADAGAAWLREHAWDRARGGCHARLEGADGAPRGDDAKTAQDTAYCALGPAAYFFVSRDPDAEEMILSLRDTLFDPTTFWDAPSGRIRDAMTPDLASEVDVEGDGGWELVAQLDPINAFLLLVQPALSDTARRDQALGDLRALADAMVTHFLADGIVWGVHTKKGEWGSKHADFGHTLKAYWMLLQLDKRLAERPYATILGTWARQLVETAYDAPNGRWGKRIQAWPAAGAPSVEYGSDWWIYAEVDQIAMTLDLLTATWDDRLAETQANWLADFVDRTRTAREVVPGIGRDGAWVWTWSDTDTAKCNEWKNGYHSVEHALVSYLHAHWLADEPVPLHFAVPADSVDTFVARPYVFAGREVSREDRGPIEVGGETLRHVVVTFDELY